MQLFKEYTECRLSHEEHFSHFTLRYLRSFLNLHAVRLFPFIQLPYRYTCVSASLRVGLFNVVLVDCATLYQWCIAASEGEFSPLKGGMQYLCEWITGAHCVLGYPETILHNVSWERLSEHQTPTLHTHTHTQTCCQADN